MSRNGYQAYSFVRMKCKVILWSLRRISMQTLGAAFGSCASCCISPIVNKECRECLKYSCLDGLQMWKIWNSINHGWLINLLFGRRITHRSQQISKDYTDAYFLNGGRFYCGLQSSHTGDLAAHKPRTVRSKGGRAGIRLLLTHANICCWKPSPRRTLILLLHSVQVGNICTDVRLQFVQSWLCRNTANFLF